MRTTMVVLAVIAASMLTACSAAGTPPAPSASVSARSAAPPADDGFERWDLVGLWRVSDAEGAGPETWLHIDAQEARLWSECGFQFGGWSAGGGQVIVDLYGFHMGCMEDGEPPIVAWLTETAAYEPAVDGWTLLSATGEVTARLRVDGVPPRHPDSNDDARQQPVVDDELKALLADVGAPDGMRAAVAEELIGRWVPVEPAANDPHVEIADDGTWAASDGCNDTRGRWAVASDGSLLTTGGPTTLVGCEGSEEPAAFGRARAAAFDGDVLVLLGVDGAEVARLAASP
jgi:hypothetical protein